MCVWWGEVLVLKSEASFMKSVLSLDLNMASKDRAQVCVARALTGLAISPAPVDADTLLKTQLSVL